jgi:hypothetical protein
MNRHERDLFRLLESEGYEVLHMTVSRHYRLRIRKLGVEFKITISRTPSDYRAMTNLKFQIRREFTKHQSRIQQGATA